MKTAKIKTPKAVLAPGVVYLGDNGRAMCVHCAGQTALYTGHDLSGMPVLALTGEALVEWCDMVDHPIAYCECEKTKSLPLDEPFNIFTAAGLMNQFRKATKDDRYGASVKDGKMRLEQITYNRAGVGKVVPVSDWIPVSQWIGTMRNWLLEANKGGEA